jgi:hypothetical protein
MNERIKELAEQATSHMPGHPPYDGLTFDVFDKEKFAELIVRECMELTKRCSTGSSIHDLFADEIIKQHFGVEE